MSLKHKHMAAETASRGYGTKGDMGELMHTHDAAKRKMNSQLCLAVSASIIVMMPTPAAAQTSQSADEPAPLGEIEGSEEIVVTAQRREERLRDVPISVSVLEGDDLDRSTATGISEELNRVSGVATTTANQSGGTQISIRGVSAAGPLFYGSSPIAYYVDSMPFGLVKSAIAPDLSAYDLERIEVLRGPQGTLYGASAQNGVVRVLTQQANLNDFEFKARGSFSATERGSEGYRADIAVNLPISSGRLAARAVVGYQNLGGWIDRPGDRNANDLEATNLRIKIGAQPIDDLSLEASAWRSRADYGAPPFSADGRTSPSTLDESMSHDFDLYGFRASYEFTNVSLVSATSYLKYDSRSGLDLTPLGLPETLLRTGLQADVFSQEVYLNSAKSKSWRWSLGGMYRNGETKTRTDFIGFPILPSLLERDSESFALFGELTSVLVGGKLELTAGLRYFHDNVGFDEVMSGSVPTSQLVHAKDEFSAWSPRVIITWHPDNQTTIYGSYAEGFRSGEIQNGTVFRVSPDIGAAAPDNLKNYELGLKKSLIGGRVQIEAAVYYIDWQDVQLPIDVIGEAGIPVAALVNGESASGLGAEMSVSARPIDGLNVGLNFSWSGLEVDNDVISGGLIMFSKGDRLNLSPEYTAGAYGDYEFPLRTEGYSGRISASLNYVSKQVQKLASGGILIAETGDSLLVGRASFSVVSNRWTGTLFIDNITNENGISAKGIETPDWSTRIRPRTFGALVEYRF